jgi:hypothetical protein
MKKRVRRSEILGRKAKAIPDFGIPRDFNYFEIPRAHIESLFSGEYFRHFRNSPPPHSCSSLADGFIDLADAFIEAPITSTPFVSPPDCQRDDLRFECQRDGADYDAVATDSSGQDLLNEGHASDDECPEMVWSDSSDPEWPDEGDDSESSESEGSDFPDCVLLQEYEGCLPRRRQCCLRCHDLPDSQQQRASPPWMSLSSGFGRGR